MICFQCQRLDLRSYPRQAKHGFGRCSVDIDREREAGRDGAGFPMSFVGFIHKTECKDLLPAAQEIVAKRVKWWEEG